MRTYEAVFADLDGRRMVCVKRHILKPFWKDGFYFCTYRPNFRGQKPYGERDVDDKKIYPHSYLELNPLKGRFLYRFVDQDRQFTRARLSADNPWLGFMMGCCTCCMRCGRFTGKFKKLDQSTQVFVDQWRNTVKVAPNNDLLAALCMAYVFDKCQNQPMVAMIGGEEEDYAAADDGFSSDSVSSEEDEDGRRGEDDNDDDDDEDDDDDDDDDDKNGRPQVEMQNMSRFKDEPDDVASRKSYLSKARSPHDPPTQTPAKPPSSATSLNGSGASHHGGMSVRSRHTQQSHHTQRSHHTQQSHHTQRSHITQQSHHTQRSHITQQSHQTQRSHITQQSHHTQQTQRTHHTHFSQPPQVPSPPDSNPQPQY